MTNMPETHGKSKARKRPYMKLFTSDWRDGTVALSLELQGLYFRILTHLHDGDDVPSDLKSLAIFLQCNPRTLRKLLPQLIAAGKLFEEDGQLRNPRLVREDEMVLSSNSAPIGREFSSNWSPIGAELELNSVPKKPKSEQNQDPPEPYYGEGHYHCHIHNQKEPSPLAAQQVASREPSSAALPKSNLDDLSDRLTAACNGALDNPVNCLGLLNLATPQMWISQGCDLDLDILPALTAAGKKYHGKRIRDWNYFTPIVAEAKARRQQTLPSVTLAEPRRKSSYDVMRAALAINAQAQGVVS